MNAQVGRQSGIRWHAIWEMMIVLTVLNADIKLQVVGKSNEWLDEWIPECEVCRLVKAFVHLLSLCCLVESLIAEIKKEGDI